MKNIRNFLLRIMIFLCICITPLLFVGCFGEDKDISVRVSDDYVQWQVTGDDNWTNLISIDEILDAIGEDIKGVDGVDGKKVEFKKGNDYILWRYEGGEWQPLIAIEDIKGNPGKDLVAEDCTITYDFNLGKSGGTYANNKLLEVFDKEGFEKQEAKVDSGNIVLKYTQTETKGNFFDLYDMNSIGLGEYFDGWYVDEIKVNKLHVVGGDIELKAKWINDISLAKLVNDNSWVFSSPDENMTVYAEPDPSGIMDGLSVAQLKKLAIYENKFYSIRNFSNKCVDDGDGYIDLVIIDDSLPEEVIYEKIEKHEYEPYYTTPFILSYNRIDGNIDGTIALTDACYINDYVIQPKKVGQYYYQVIYKVNYETCEAEVINVLGNDLLASGFDTYKITIDDFTVCKDGNEYEIKVKAMKDNWFNVLTNLPDPDNENIIGEYELSCIIGENINYVGLDAYLPANEDLNSWEYIIDPNAKLTYHIYSKKTDITEEIEVKTSQSMIPTEAIIYYYSESQPTDTQHNYWHYNEQGEIVVWEVASQE